MFKSCAWAPLLLLSVPAIQASAASYTYQPVVVPGSSYTFARSINDSGMVAGDYSTGTGRRALAHCFLLSGGVYQNVDPPGETSVTTTGLSNDGTVIGTFRAGTRREQSFTYKNGVFTIYSRTGRNTELQAISHNGLAMGSVESFTYTHLIDLLAVRDGTEIRLPLPEPGFFDFVAGVNNAGAFTGNVGPDRNSAFESAYLVKDGITRLIVIPQSTQTSPFGINDAGLVAGDYTDRTTNRFVGFTYLDGVVTDVQDPDGVQTVIYGLNDSGDLVGSTYDVRGVHRPFATYKGVFTTLQPDGAAADPGYVSAINASGQVVGYHLDSNDTYVSYIATPQP